MKIYYLLFLPLFITCKVSNSKEKQKSEEAENIILTPANTVDRIDTIPIGQISSVVVQNDFIMIGEYNRHRVLVTDINFKLKHMLGKEGQGPGEFSNTQHHILKKNKIYANDLGNVRINIFDILNGKFIKSIKLPDRPVLPTAQFYLDDNKNIYYATQPYANGKMLIKLDSNGKIIKRFGENFQKTNNIEEDINISCREMIVHKNRIIVVGQTFGIVEIYDLNGNKINSFDISNHEPIKTNFILAKKQIKERPNTTPNLQIFCYVREDKLYINTADRTSGLINKRDFMVFKWSDTSCELIKTINLKTNKLDESTLYSPIFISEDEKTIYAQGLKTKNLYVFKMP